MREILSTIFVLKTSRNAMKHVINEGGGHILSFLNARIPKIFLDTVSFKIFFGGGHRKILGSFHSGSFKPNLRFNSFVCKSNFVIHLLISIGMLILSSMLGSSLVKADVVFSGLKSLEVFPAFS